LWALSLPRKAHWLCKKTGTQTLVPLGIAVVTAKQLLVKADSPTIIALAE
jgi:hypothetical protein